MEKKTQIHNRRNENSVVDPVYDEIEYYPVISDFCRNQITYCIELSEMKKMPRRLIECVI